jgi:large subunit ribosomal protein L6
MPAEVEVVIDGQSATVKGPKGTLKFDFHHRVVFEKKDSQILVTVRKEDEKRSRELWGTSRVLLANMIEGVTKGFEKKLEISGVGFRAAVSGKKLTLQVGFSHPVEFSIPEGIEIKVEKNIIIVSGIDKQLVGETAARIRAIKKPEPYKGKGIKYVDEVIRRKAGKVVKTAAA